MPDLPPLRCRCNRIVGAKDVPAKGCCPDWLLGYVPQAAAGEGVA